MDDAKPEWSHPEWAQLERAVLAGLLEKPERIWELDLESKHFFLPMHGAIFEVIAEVASSGHKGQVDWMTVATKVKERGPWSVGSYDLVEMQERWEGALGLHGRAKALRNYWLRSQLKGTLSTLTQRAIDESQDTADVMVDAIAAIQDLLKGKTTASWSKNYGMAMLERAAQLLTMKPGESLDVKTGLYSLDLQIGGLPRPGLTLVGGRLSRGKSAFLRNVAENVARQGKGSVEFFSAEDSLQAIADRALASATNIELRTLRQRQFDKAGEERLLQIGHAIGAFGNFNVHDKPALTTKDIREVCLRRRMAGPISLIVVDYIQRLGDRPRAGEKRHEVIGRMAKLLRDLAGETGAAMLCGAQLGRSAEEKKEPSLTDLRESGDLEQDADVVLLIGGVQDPDTPGMKLLIAKQRNGPIGAVDLIFERAVQRITDPTEPDEPSLFGYSS